MVRTSRLLVLGLVLAAVPALAAGHEPRPIDIAAAANNGDWSTGSLNTAGLAAINKTGTTQLRIYFNLDDDNDRIADYIGYYSGDNGAAANRPQLMVTYQ